MKSDSGEEPDYADYEYSELLGISFKIAAAGDLYEEHDGVFTDIKEDSEKLSQKLKDAESLTIVGIAKYTDDASKVGQFHRRNGGISSRAFGLYNGEKQQHRRFKGSER